GARCVGGAVRLKLPAGCTYEPAGAARRMLGELLPAARPRRLSRKCPLGTGNLLVHRDVVDAVGRFDTSRSLAGEDTDFLRRMSRAGFEAWYTPHAVVHHVIPESRLEYDPLRRTSLRIGSHVAQREYDHFGRVG